MARTSELTESRISQAAYRRFFYYLTGDERTGDLMRAVVDIDYKLLEIDPMRLASQQKTRIPYPARVRGGSDWLAFAGNWMTEWERTGNVVFELNDLIDHPGWRKAWREYGLLVHAPKEIVAKDRAGAGGTEGADGQYGQYGRLVAYAYRDTKNPALAKKVWSLVRVPGYATTHFDAPAVLHALDEIPGLSANSVAQSCLKAIEVLEMCGDPV